MVSCKKPELQLGKLGAGCLTNQHYQSGHARDISPSPGSNRSSRGSGPAGWAPTNLIFLACLFLQRGISWLCIGLNTSAQLRKMLVPPHPNSQANHCLKCLLITGNEGADGFTGNHTGVRGWEFCPSAPLTVREIQSVQNFWTRHHTEGNANLGKRVKPPPSQSSGGWRVDATSGRAETCVQGLAQAWAQQYWKTTDKNNLKLPIEGESLVKER